MSDQPDFGPLDDDALMALLGRTLAEADPVPASVIAAARGAETWRTIDAELAEIVFDSALETAGTRAATTARELTFRAGGVELEIMLVGGVQAGIEGQVIPPMGELVELVSLTGAGTADVDEAGRFRFAEIPAGPVRLSLRLPIGWVHTSWVVLRSA